ELYIVPEVRLAAVRQALYDRPMPSRLVRLFARVAGAQPVRRWQAAHAKPMAKDTTEGVEILERRPPAPAQAPAPKPDPAPVAVPTPAASLRPLSPTPSPAMSAA